MNSAMRKSTMAPSLIFCEYRTPIAITHSERNTNGAAVKKTMRPVV